MSITQRYNARNLIFTHFAPRVIGFMTEILLALVDTKFFFNKATLN